MTQLRFVSGSLFASAALIAVVLAPTPAYAVKAAPGCSADTDCAKGFECTVVGTSGCGAAPCAPGSSCPEPEPCETVVEKACTPAHCESNADCAEGMVCFEFATDCVATCRACPPDQEEECGCDARACDPQPNKMCAPRYVLPCQAAADCGEGFTCEEQLSCGCSGSAGSEPAEPPPGPAPAADRAAPADGDAAPPPDCSCEPSGVMACIPKDITCTTGSDCPVGWTCTPEPSAEVPGCSSGDCGAAAPQPAPRNVCIPDHYSGVGETVDAGGTPSREPTAPGTDNGGSVPPQPEASSGGGESNESAACQMGRAPASQGAFSLLLVLGALLGLKRRRA